MTLTLEDVQNVRFPIAKRVGEGYRATEVDDFVDRVDATFGSMIEENQRLKAQLDALDGQSQGAQGGSDELKADNDRLRKELEEARAEVARANQAAQAARLAQNNRPAVAAPVVDDAELKRLRQENADLRGQLEQARQSTPLSVVDGNNNRVEKILVTTAAQASPAVTRLVQLATEQAEAVVAEARGEAERTVDDAKRAANEITIDAQTRADRIQSEARVNADNLKNDVAKRRTELFSQLESERDQLISTVEGLRSFEASYRKNLTSHFRSQLQTLEGSHLEPSGAPALLSHKTGSSTPRLDALLSDNAS